MLFSYEEFAFNNNAISSIYKASEVGPDKTSPDNIQDASLKVQSEIKDTGRFTYSYLEYLQGFLTKFCCFCCKGSMNYRKKVRRYENYIKAKESLESELDMERLLNG